MLNINFSINNARKFYFLVFSVKLIYLPNVFLFLNSIKKYLSIVQMRVIENEELLSSKYYGVGTLI